jgi:hypothetical protein
VILDHWFTARLGEKRTRRNKPAEQLGLGSLGEHGRTARKRREAPRGKGSRTRRSLPFSSPLLLPSPGARGGRRDPPGHRVCVGHVIRRMPGRRRRRRRRASIPSPAPAPAPARPHVIRRRGANRRRPPPPARAAPRVPATSALIKRSHGARNGDY